MLKTSDSNDVRRNFQYMALRFQADEKASGKIGRHTYDYIANYTETDVDYKRSPTQETRYFRSLFDGEAKSSYLNFVHAECNHFENACVRIESPFSNLARQISVRKYLQKCSIMYVIKNKS